MRAKISISSVIGFSIAGALLATDHSARAGLIEYLPLNGTTTAPVGTSGTPVNSPTYGPDQNSAANGAINFAPGGSSSSSYVSVTGGGGLDGLNTGTIAFWVKWNGTQEQFCCGADYGAVTARQSNGVFSDDVIGLDNANPALAHVEVRLDSCCAVDVAGGTVVGNGVWHFVAFTFTAGAEDLYLDGNLDGSSTNSPAVNSSSSIPLTLGAWTGDGNEYSNSNMDDFRVYNNALTQAQIQALIPEADPAWTDRNWSGWITRPSKAGLIGTTEGLHFV